jgi:hypothetical protein
MEVGGGLQRPAECACLISEEVWSRMSEEDRRSIIGVLDRTKANTMNLPDVLPNGTYSFYLMNTLVVISSSLMDGLVQSPTSLPRPLAAVSRL